MKIDLPSVEIERPDRQVLECASPLALSLGKVLAQNQSTLTSAFRKPRRGALPMTQIWILATKEFGDRFRSGWVVACVMVWLGAIGLTSFLGLLQIGQIGVQGYERTVVSLLNLVQYLVPLLGLLLGHDLIVSEKEERTLGLLIAGGVSRTRLLLGKFLGGSLSLALPLALGFSLAGAVVGLTARDTSILPFIKLALSGMVLGILFLGIGLAISTLFRTRVQALVAALLTWCLFVFVFDLVAMGLLVSTKSPAAAREIELVCDATHVNAAADIHSDFDTVAIPTTSSPARLSQSLGWLAINPIDLFRAVNLSNRLELRIPARLTVLSSACWVVFTLGLSVWKLRRTDL